MDAGAIVGLVIAIFVVIVVLRSVRIVPQCGMLTIGARPITLPDLITAAIFRGASNSPRKSLPDNGGTVVSGDCGLGTPPKPLAVQLPLVFQLMFAELDDGLMFGPLVMWTELAL